MTLVWSDLGFDENPFNPKHLEVDLKGYMLFIGRELEGNHFFTNISTTKGGTVIVEGDVGVGKTSFLNVQQYKCWQHYDQYGLPHLLPSFSIIEFSRNATTASFLLTVLSNILASLMKMFSEKRVRSNKVCKGILNLISTTIHQSVGFQLSVLGTGGGMSTGRQMSQPISIILPELIGKLDRLLEEIEKRFKLEGVIVPIDNIDTLDERQILDFLNQLRDIIMVKDRLWFVLIGHRGFFSLLEAKAHRVSEIIVGEPIILEPLSLAEVKEAIRVRLEQCRMTHRSPQAPVAPEVIELLYDVSHGEIRYIFKRATDAVLDLRLHYPTEKCVTLDLAKVLLSRMARSKLERIKLTAREEEVLRKMVELKEFRSKDYVAFGLNSAQAFNKYLNKFREQRFINKTEEIVNGRKLVMYRTGGDINLAFGIN